MQQAAANLAEQCLRRRIPELADDDNLAGLARQVVEGPQQPRWRRGPEMAGKRLRDSFRRFGQAALGAIERQAAALPEGMASSATTTRAGMALARRLGVKRKAVPGASWKRSIRISISWRARSRCATWKSVS